MPFFGRPAMTTPALAQFALRFRCPVIPVYPERLGPRGSYLRIAADPAQHQRPNRDVGRAEFGDERHTRAVDPRLARMLVVATPALAQGTVADALKLPAATNPVSNARLHNPKAAMNQLGTSHCRKSKRGLSPSCKPAGTRTSSIDAARRSLQESPSTGSADGDIDSLK